jgi:Cft2 family RNA processing exonuclease
MIKFNIENDFGIYASITANGLFKIRRLKKILKFHFSKEGEWPIIELFGDNFFNDTLS